jgi:hypothetical protein
MHNYESKFLIAIAVLFAAACGSSQASGNAIISGVVHDQSAAVAGAQLSMANRTARTDAAGQFSMSVPAGSAALHVSTAGADHVLQFGTVVDSMRLDLVVSVSGGSAEIESAEVELSGAISAIALPDFTVAGKTIVTDSSTEVEPGTLADLKVGEEVHIDGVLQSNGSVLAREIEAGSEAEGEGVELEGVVQSVTPPTLKISGRSVETNSKTRIVRGDDVIALADVMAGDRVHVRGKLEADGTTILARIIKVAPGFALHVELDGTIDSITPPDLKVSGLTVVTDQHTEIEQNDKPLSLADLKTGEHVRVKGVPQQDGTILALRIEVALVEPPPPPQRPGDLAR